MPETLLNFHWEKRGERYVFRSETLLPHDPDACNEQLADIARWCRVQKLKAGQFRFEAIRKAFTEKVETFRVDGRQSGFVGGTTFHPVKLTVELELPDRLGPVFTMAFPTTDERWHFS